MKDRFATGHAKELGFLIYSFENELEPWVPSVLRALGYLRFAGVACLAHYGPQGQTGTICI